MRSPGSIRNGAVMRVTVVARFKLPARVLDGDPASCPSGVWAVQRPARLIKGPGWLLRGGGMDWIGNGFPGGAVYRPWY